MDSRCVKVPKSLAKKIHRCDKCNLVLGRDHNASINILKKRLKIFNLYAKADYHKLPVPAGHNGCKDLNEAGRNNSLGDSLPIFLKDSIGICLNYALRAVMTLSL